MPLILDHPFTGATASTFTSDVEFAHIAGAKPTIVRSPVAKGLRFDGGAQGIVEHTIDPFTGALTVDTVWRLTAPVTATSEVVQLRAGVARGPALAFTDTNHLRLLRLSGAIGASAATSTATLPVGSLFRLVWTVNGANLTVSLYPDTTTTTPTAVLSSTTSDPITPTALRLGVITATGIGTADADTFHPQVTTGAFTLTARTWPALPVEAPQAIAAQPAPVQPWTDNVTLSGRAVEETSPIASLVWAPTVGNPVLLNVGSGATRTFTAPASLDRVDLDFTLTATDSAGRVGSTTVTVPVLPADTGIFDGTAWVPLRNSYGHNDAPPPAPEELPAITPVLLAAQPDFQQATFTTPPELNVERVVQWRVKGATDWVPVNPGFTIRPNGDHTATFGVTQGVAVLNPATTYEGRIILTATGYNASVTVIEFTTAAANAEPTPVEPDPGEGGGPTPTDTLVWDRSMYPDASHPLGDWRTWPLAYWLPSGSTFPVPAGATRLAGPVVDWRAVKGKKFRVRCPETFVNPVSPPMFPDAAIVVQGLCVRYDTWNVDPAKPLTNPDGSVKQMGYGFNTSATQPTVSNNYFTYKGGGDGEANEPRNQFIALEGGGILPGPDGKVKTTEFINYDGKSFTDDTFVIQNIRCGDATATQGISWVSIGGTGAHAGGDVGQWWNGPSNLYILGLVGVSSYQGIFDQSKSNGTADTRLKKYRRVHLKGDVADGSAYLFWDTTQGDLSIVRDFGTGDNGFYIQPTDGKARDRLIWQANTFGHDDPIVIGAPPRDFVPLSELRPWRAEDDAVRWGGSSTVAPAPPPAGTALTVNGRTFPSFNTAAGGSGLPFNSAVFTGSWSTSTADAFATWRGRPVDGMMNWVPWTGTWADTRVFPAMRPSGLYILGVPLHPRGVGTTNAAVAAGTWNAEITAWAKAAIAAGLNQSRVVFRLGWECNGTWYPWSWDKGGVANYIAAFRRFVDLCRAAGLTAPFWSWNLNKGPQAYNNGYSWRTGFPGKAHVDIVGIDSYDHYSPTFTLADWESNVGMSKNPGIRDVAAFATEQSLLWSLEEWGVANPKDTNRGGDNPYYIARSWDLLNELKANLAYEVTYDDEGAPATLNHKMSNGTNPLAGAAYRASSRWGS